VVLPETSSLSGDVPFMECRSVLTFFLLIISHMYFCRESRYGMCVVKSLRILQEGA
jgi:hypothetical protein